jgi:hypothetical protein
MLMCTEFSAHMNKVRGQQEALRFSYLLRTLRLIGAFIAVFDSYDLGFGFGLLVISVITWNSFGRQPIEGSVSSFISLLKAEVAHKGFLGQK